MTTESLEGMPLAAPRTTTPRKDAPKPALPGDAPIVHVYDDIEEMDNHLPNWWLFTLYAAMVFALGYWFYYHTFQVAPLSREAFEQAMAADYAQAAERARRAGAMTPEALLALSRDRATVAEGREVFTSNCVACHGAAGGGNIGPNLTDNAWLHGGAPNVIYRTVLNGVTTRGMPAWGPQLGDRRVQSVVAYLLTIKNTNVAGRPPQGNPE